MSSVASFDMYPVATYVKAIDGKVIEVHFENGDKRRLSLDQLLKINPLFEKLKDEDLFNKVYVDYGGYGLIWSPEVDIASSSVWLNGTPID